MLKKSVVKRSACRSVIRKFLISEKSQFAWNGPRNMLRPRLPNVVSAAFGIARAARGISAGRRRGVNGRIQIAIDARDTSMFAAGISRPEAPTGEFAPAGGLQAAAEKRGARGARAPRTASPTERS